MPTGYTAVIYNTIHGEEPDPTFEDFTLRCARNFGALINMRDEPWSAPIPEVLAPDTFYLDQVGSYRVKLEQLERLLPGDAQAAAEEHYQIRLKMQAASERLRLALADKYQAMISQVIEWEPPTWEHEGLKKFMLQQLDESLQWDCSPRDEEIVLQSGPVWLAEQLAAMHKQIANCTLRYEEEVARTAGRNRWLEDLRASLVGKSKGQNSD